MMKPNTHTSLANNSRQTLWQQIAEDFALAIEQGKYRPGDALPAAADVSTKYAVHRHTVRQAFRFLADRGLVSVEQGRGTFVTRQRIPYRIGKSVSFRSNFAAIGLTTKNTILETSVTTASYAPTLELDPATPIWRTRMVSEAGGLPISTSTHFLARERFAEFPERLMQSGGSISEAFALYGITAYMRLSTRLYARNASEMEARLLQLPPGTPVLQTTGLDGTPQGERLQVVETAFASDRIDIVVEPE